MVSLCRKSINSSTSARCPPQADRASKGSKKHSLAYNPVFYCGVRYRCLQKAGSSKQLCVRFSSTFVRHGHYKYPPPYKYTGPARLKKDNILPPAILSLDAEWNVVAYKGQSPPDSDALNFALRFWDMACTSNRRMMLEAYGNDSIRRSLQVRCRDCVPSVELRRRLSLTSIPALLVQRKLRWFGNAAKRPDGKLIKDPHLTCVSYNDQSRLRALLRTTSFRLSTIS